MGKNQRQKHQGRKMQIRPGYHTARDAITCPGDIFGFSLYFLYYWVPLLGPGLAWLVMALKERADEAGGVCWHLDDLAKEIGVPADDVRRWMHSEYACWFIGDPQKRNPLRELVVKATGHGTPPIPRHLAGVAALLQRHLPPGGDGDRVEMAIKAMRRILDAGQVHKQVLEATDSSPWQVNASDGPLTVLQVVWQVADLPPAESISQEQRDALFKLAIEIEAETTLAGFYGCSSNYFRRNWVPLLGPELAWLVVYLQNYSRGNSEIESGIDWQMDDLARGVTVPVKDVTAIIGGASLPELLESEYGRMFVRLEKTGGEPTFRVRINTPVVPGTVWEDVVEQIDDDCWVPVHRGGD